MTPNNQPALPALPEPFKRERLWDGEVIADYYVADQMHAYALESLRCAEGATPVAWWNGQHQSKLDDLDPSIHWGGENSSHDIPLFAGCNPHSEIARKAAVYDKLMAEGAMLREGLRHCAEHGKAEVESMTRYGCGCSVHDSNGGVNRISVATPTAQRVSLDRHCQNGRADVCRASQRDGIVCPADSCDIDDGVREPDTAQRVAAGEITGWRLVDGVRVFSAKAAAPSVPDQEFVRYEDYKALTPPPTGEAVAWVDLTHGKFGRFYQTSLVADLMPAGRYVLTAPADVGGEDA